MTIQRCIELLKNEIDCVNSNDTCSHECADCELVKPTEDILEMYSMCIRIIEGLQEKITEYENYQDRMYVVGAIEFVEELKKIIGEQNEK